MFFETILKLIMQKQESENLKIVISTTKNFYKSIKEIYCPILNTKIIFNSIGLRHLMYKPDGTARNSKEVVYKMKLFPLAIPTIKNAVRIAEERKINFRVNRKKNSKHKRAKTFSLVAIVGKKNPVAVRVIILRVGNGNYSFYSIMKD